jgi:hypothetical protein
VGKLLEPTTRLEVPAHVYARKFGGETVLLDFGKGDYFGLDEVGTVLWDTVAGGGTVLDAVSAIVVAFDAPDQTRVQTDLLELATELVGAGLLACPAGPAGPSNQ